MIRIARRAGFAPSPDPDDPLADDDMQLALYLCYELCTAARGRPGGKRSGISTCWRSARMERAFKTPSRRCPRASGPRGRAGSAPRSDNGLAVRRVHEHEATLDQFEELSSIARPTTSRPTPYIRLAGAVEHRQGGFAEIQADEYGGGKPGVSTPACSCR